MKFIGRYKELKDLKHLILKDRSQLISIMGRRGIGKTELLNHFKKQMKDEFVVISLYGQKNVSTKKQLNNVLNILEKEFTFNSVISDWNELFYELVIKLKENKNRKYLFTIDEFPWLHVKKSNFIQDFSSFWNEIQNLSNVHFILTGSAVAWMNRKLINTNGGLYGKVVSINLKPFTFEETVEFLKNINPNYSLSECLKYYLLTNGVARYLTRIEYRFDIQQNMEKIFKYDEYFNEFDLLFTSSFESNLKIHQNIIELFKNKHFITSSYIEKKLKISSASISNALEDLLCSDLIVEHNNFVKKLGGQEKQYSINDLFCFSFLKFNELKNNQREFIMDGYAFEIFTRKNIHLIREELGRKGVEFELYIFESEKAQVDLLLKDADLSYFLIECKNHINEFEINNNYRKNLENKLEQVSIELRKTKKWNLKLIMFTVYGCKQDKQLPFLNISLEDIFKKI